MYYPYLRGKQFELSLLRDNSELISNNNIHPIIEPVRKNIKMLFRALEDLNKNNIECTLIVNPLVGELTGNNQLIIGEFVNDKISQFDNIFIGIIVDANISKHKLENLLKKYSSKKVTLIHYGFSSGKEIVDLVNKYPNIETNIFIDKNTGKLYQSHFEKMNAKKILIRDGFKLQRKNALYPITEHFSDLHITYKMENMDGFGDYLIVGDEFSDTGGPAYAVAIHLTYLNKADNDMYIYHFLSDQTDSPTDPGGKFLEALQKLIRELKKSTSNIYLSEACNQFNELYNKQHFPGLGQVKKISMQHHLELIANYLK